MLTLQWILQVLLTNKCVKIDCLAHADVFLDVNRDWTGKRGVGFGFVPRLEIVGCFWSVNSC